MATLLRQNRRPADVMALVAAEDKRRDPYKPCPCGSGRKFRFCHGSNERRLPVGTAPAESRVE
jgi:uncharacterized protein